MSLADVRWIDLGSHLDARGELYFAEVGKHLPFVLPRVYFIRNVPNDKLRGTHGHRTLEQVVVPVVGQMTVVADDGKNVREYRLDNPARGLFLPKMIWREIKDFTPDGVCLLLPSEKYDEAEYIRDRAEFERLTR